MALLIQLTTTARRRFYQIEQYHIGEGNPKKGKRTVQKLIKQIKKLRKHPELGALTAELSDNEDEYRVLVVLSDYKVIYSLEEDIVIIEEIFDVRQDPSRLKLG